jgi:predicted TIM-barrel fold metal-dependent hydrolase
VNESPDAMPLSRYRPRSRMRTTASHVPRPRFPAIDAHNHLGTAFGGDWPTRSAGELAAELESAGIEAIVDLDGGWGEGLRHEIDRWQRPLPGRVAVFAGLDYDRWAEDGAFGETEAARLRDGVAAGARGLKVWKTLGLRARGPDGRLVAVDDPRLDPLWATAGELGVPVTIHVADPIAFFDPLDETNERWEELQAHPDWHFWPPRPAGRTDEPGFPSFDELLDGLEAIVARHPATTFIGAHVGCAAEDLARVDRMLSAYPNWNVDIAARIAELGRQPRRTGELFERWPNRILFGVDSGPDPAFYAVHFRFLETTDESFPYDIDDGDAPTQGRWAIHGLGLPDEVLRQVYRDNARRLIAFD